MLNNQRYSTCEHFIQSEKAKHYGDSKSELAILSCKTPLEAKRLAHKISKPSNTQDWNEVAKDICSAGIREKFHQNTNLQILLISTNDQTLVEASTDSKWGTGMPLKDDNCLDQTGWKNVGILGKILMDLQKAYQSSDLDISDQNTVNYAEQPAMTNQNSAIQAAAAMTNPNKKHD